MERIIITQKWQGYEVGTELDVTPILAHYLIDTYQVAKPVIHTPAEISSTSAKMQAKPKRNKMLRRPASSK